MSYIYEAIDKAKEAIAASFSNIEEKYKDVFALIDAIWNAQLHRPLHAASYYLNLEFYNANPNVEQDEERYDSRDTIDPILLDKIDESNKWLLGRLTLNSDKENATVFEDDDFTWGDVARAAGVDEDAYSLRSQATKEPRGTSKTFSSKASKKASSSNLLDTV
ncbi:hypothetical protein Sango_1869200 [Sesamum angolense]|uniref:Uncharacterized protein n=1 Tax=Sesamum angolense TaxID=2727404 RepID=A0AAE1WII3_9LAMI|nr:hypothetical protein Sango_1869200 [Sesamum angolense]